MHFQSKCRGVECKNLCDRRLGRRQTTNVLHCCIQNSL